MEKIGQSAGKTVSEHEIAWLAGIIDGDGCITVTIVEGKRRPRRLSPTVNVITTCIETGDYLKGLYERLGVGHYIQYRKPKNKNHESWTIVTRGLKRTAKLLPLLMPYLVTKKQEAEWLWELVNNRLSINKFDENNKLKRLPYTAHEMDLAKAIKAKKRNRNLREHTLGLSNDDRDDVLRPVWRHTEVSRNACSPSI